MDIDKTLDNNIEPENNDGSIDLTELFDNIMQDKKDTIRNQVSKELDDLEQQAINPVELDNIMTQFGTFASMQLLRIVALKLYGDKGNAIISEIIQSFISQGKSALMIKQQIDSIEQQESKLTTLLGNELIEKERELIATRVNKLYDAFELEVKSTLLIDDLPGDTVQYE